VRFDRVEASKASRATASMLEKANHMHVFVAVVRVKLQKRCTAAQPAASVPLQPPRHGNKVSASWD